MPSKHIVSLEVKLYAFLAIVRVSIQLNSVNFTSQGRPLYPLDMRYAGQGEKSKTSIVYDRN
jgi:hypothetical protein